MSSACWCSLRMAAGPDGVREQGPIQLFRLWRLCRSVGCPRSRS